MKQFHGFNHVHVGDHLAQADDEFMLLGIKQQLLAPRSTGGDVDCRPDSFFDELSVQVQFSITRALELLDAAAGLSLCICAR